MIKSGMFVYHFDLFQMKKMAKRIRRLFLLMFVAGLLVPQRFSMPVEGAGKSDYHPDTFWFSPWGKSGTHKGVDIFAATGQPVLSSTAGLVVYTGQIEMGGNVVLVLGPKWRLHYYAHLDDIATHTFSWVHRQERIGSVGTSGNAAGKAAHLHYSIVTPIPYPWRIDGSVQGWKKMFYLNPITYLEE